MSAPKPPDNAVLGVFGQSLHEKLRGEDALAVPADRHVDVRGSERTLKRVGDRLDGTEVGLALRVGEKSPVP